MNKRPKAPTQPKKVKSSYVKQRIQFTMATDDLGLPYIPREQGHRFIKNYNYNLAQTYKKVPEVRNELQRQLKQQGFKLTKSGLIRYTESQNIKLLDLGYGKDKINLLSNEGIKRAKHNAEVSGDKRPVGKILKSRLYVEYELKKLDFFYSKNAESKDRYGVRDYDFTKSREDIEKIAPELFKKKREQMGIKQLTYKELEKAIRKLKKAKII